MKKTGAKNLGGRPVSNDSIRAKALWLSDELRFKVTPKMVREWQEKDFPIDDPEALLTCISSQQRAPGDLTPVEVLRQHAVEKLLKTRAERLTKELQLEVERKSLIPVSRVEEMWIIAMTRVRAVTQKIRSEPPTWAGLAPHDLSKKGAEIADEIEMELSDVDSY